MADPPNAPNPRKRPSPPGSTPTSTQPDRKRARIISSRTIITQTNLPELKTGQLNVAAFVKSRKFEIAALQRSMATAKTALKQRAFQSVPRDMRRRTASHNSKRVPKKLRDRAEKEMKEDNTPTHTFRKRKKSGHDRLRAETAEKLKTMAKKREVVEGLIHAVEGKGGELVKPPRAHSKWRKRQKGKVWLPTHVWHAKRAHMEIRWRFSVPESPNDKCFRSTQRAVEKRGGVAWDTSYWSHILVRGEGVLVRMVLEAVFPGAGGDAKVRMGKRSKECWAYERGGYPDKPIGPVTVIWSPAEEEGKGRRVLVRVHPSAFYKVWEELLCAMRAQNPTEGLQKVFIDDMRFELGSIQISGPNATDALLSMLTPTNPDGEIEKNWIKLRGLTNPAALPPQVAFGFEIADPRLRFPPRLEKSKLSPEQQQAELFTMQSTWPITPRPFNLLDTEKRVVAVKLQASEKRIQKRKTDATPGTFPAAIANDPKIPIILVSSQLAGNNSGAPNKIPGAWTVILPWKWMQPVWYALMHTTEQIRFGGIKELQHMAFDHGLPWFPADFPGTDAGKTWEDELAAKRKETWDKKPPQKRLNYDAVKISGKKGEIGDWSRCDWAYLVPAAAGSSTHKMDVDIPTTSSLLAPIDTMATVSTAPQSEPTAPPQKSWWQIPSALATIALKTYPSLPASLDSVTEVLDKGIFTVKITFLHRGAPTACSRIYRLPHADTTWKSLAANIKAKKGDNVVEAGKEGYPQCPSEEDLVGFVTTGNYSLTTGQSVALGGIVWGAWFEDERSKERLCVVRGVGETVGRLARWEVV
ncbi:ribonucleases P/MRP protein subunit POP1-domain-containing protein [Tricharina praecox]|uniref:ribonucleases P/MRP protein subunit POP1-domain-containing protein n=1 Tax=Tricharina praecox TaxID=43433 RepID=UPI002220E0C2|nr:ribonucleases P/MRP protein subunit POP1-domain-containing protein [Tricharina praecox]KAI5846138.1 ribonucleases P/MRP protein subunit POP1-domain-containing protein [Tricharina praecox]